MICLLCILLCYFPTIALDNEHLDENHLLCTSELTCFPFYFFLGVLPRITEYDFEVHVYKCHVQLFVTLRTIAHQTPLSMGFSRKEYWSGLPYPPPGDLPNPGIKPTSLMSPALTDGFFTTRATCLLFSWSVVSDSLGPHGLQRTRLPCPSPFPDLAQTYVHWVSDAI